MEFKLAEQYYTGIEPGRPNYAFSRGIFGRLAKKGHLNAQFVFGLLLICGVGGPFDLNGVRWITRAASRGHPQARYCCSLRLFRGGFYRPRL